MIVVQLSGHKKLMSLEFYDHEDCLLSISQDAIFIHITADYRIC